MDLLSTDAPVLEYGVQQIKNVNILNP